MFRKSERAKIQNHKKACKALAKALKDTEGLDLDSATKKLVLADGDEFDVQAKLLVSQLDEIGFKIVKKPAKDVIALRRK